jgi:hypothetical protein
VYADAFRAIPRAVTQHSLAPVVCPRGVQCHRPSAGTYAQDGNSPEEVAAFLSAG